MKAKLYFLKMETKIQFKKGDITKVKTEAIVNAADNELSHGGGVSGAIHRAAGPKLLEECKKVGCCKTGEAKLTKGYELPADYVIQTVGPIWRGGNNDEAEKLASAYKSSLHLALENDIETVAFPAISTGIYGYSIKKAAKIAFSSTKEFLENNNGIRKVIFVLHSEKDYQIYKDTFKELN